MRLRINERISLVANLHFSPLTPHLGKIFHRFEIHLGAFLQDFTGAVQVWFGLPSGTSLFVKLGKINIESVEIGSSLSGDDSLQGLGIGRCNLKTRG